MTGPLLTVSEYTIQVIKKMQRDHIKSWVPKQSITDAFNEHVQGKFLFAFLTLWNTYANSIIEWIKHTVWKDSCRSWYRNNETGRVNAVYPGSSLQYIDVVSSPRYEDFEIEYMHKNPWAALGMGYAKSNVQEKADLSPYLQIENIDPNWLESIGYKGPALEIREEREKKEKIESNGEVRGS